MWLKKSSRFRNLCIQLKEELRELVGVPLRKSEMWLMRFPVNVSLRMKTFGAIGRVQVNTLFRHYTAYKNFTTNELEREKYKPETE